MSFAVAAPDDLACPACGFRGAPSAMDYEGLAYYSCGNCGLVVSVRPRPGEAGAAPGGQGGPRRRVLLGEASPLLRQAVREQLAASRQAVQVVECADGFELLTRFAEALRHGEQPSCVVLDVGIPILDGKNAALMLRGVEDAFDLPEPTPILFFTVQPEDDAFKKLNAYLRSCRYLAKAEGATPQQLAAALVGALHPMNGRP